MKTLQKAMAVGLLTALSGYAAAAPIFNFDQRAGFRIGDVAVADYTGALGVGGLNPTVATSSTMSWYKGASAQSSLNLATESTSEAGGIATGVWHTITTLSHENDVITWPGPGPSPHGWTNQTIYGVFNLYDGATLLFSDETQTLISSLEETANDGTCGPNNPLNSNCDDVFVFGSGPFASIEFQALDGSNWIASFQFANFVNSALDLPNIYTAEGELSSLDVQVMLTQVTETPEPTSLSIMGLGLLGLSLAMRRKNA